MIYLFDSSPTVWRATDCLITREYSGLKRNTLQHYVIAINQDHCLALKIPPFYISKYISLLYSVFPANYYTSYLTDYLYLVSFPAAKINEQVTFIIGYNTIDWMCVMCEQSSAIQHCE